REPAGDLELLVRAARALFDAKEEVRRLQHRLDDDLGAAEELVRAGRLFREQAGILFGFAVGQRAAEGPQPEVPDEFIREDRVGRRRGLAGNEAVRVAAA